MRVGDSLRSLVRAYDHAGRYGGEEFIILAQELSAIASSTTPSAFAPPWRKLMVMHEGIAHFRDREHRGCIRRECCASARRT